MLGRMTPKSPSISRDMRKLTVTASAQSDQEPPRKTFVFPCGGPAGSSAGLPA